MKLDMKKMKNYWTRVGKLHWEIVSVRDMGWRMISCFIWLYIWECNGWYSDEEARDHDLTKSLM